MSSSIKRKNSTEKIGVVSTPILNKQDWAEKLIYSAQESPYFEPNNERNRLKVPLTAPKPPQPEILDT